MRRILETILIISGAAVVVAGLSAVIAIQQVAEWMKNKLNI